LDGKRSRASRHKGVIVAPELIAYNASNESIVAGGLGSDGNFCGLTIGSGLFTRWSHGVGVRSALPMGANSENCGKTRTPSASLKMLTCGKCARVSRRGGCDVAGDGIDLTKVIQQLRHDIEKTWWEGQQSAVAMEVGPVELEVTVAVEKDADAKLGVKFYVLDASAGAKGAMTNTQRIKIVLTPRDRRSPTGPLLIGAVADEGDNIPTLSGEGG